MRDLNVGELRGPDHLAPAGQRRSATVRPTAATMARFLCGLSDIALEAIAKTSGTISTKARATEPAFSLVQSRHGRQSDRFSSHKGFRVTRSALKKSFGATCARIFSRHEPPLPSLEHWSNGARSLFRALQ